MSFPALAAIGAERLLFSLDLGTLLAAVVWLLLRVFPRKDSRTSFAVWFATLVMMVALPVPGLFRSHASGYASAVITVSSAWAVWIFVLWASVAFAGLVRVAVALRHVRKLRQEAAELDVEQLKPELRELLAQFNLDPTLCAKNAPGMGHPGFVRKTRSLELRVSKRLEVPTAIGFFQPAIVLPQWLLEATPAEELKYILLHELEHLRRRDDWTNLAQQVVKALLFFVPSVWWIERKLALEREMACDDAVLAQAGTARGYAECLAHVAERSLLRRQLALAQAAVTKLKQLTLRVTKILDPNRPQAPRVWRPAVPAVVVVAGLCVFTASQGPQLIGFANGEAMAQGSANAPALVRVVPSPVGMRPMRQTSATDAPKFVPANLKLNSAGEDARGVRVWSGSSKRQKTWNSKRAIHTLANLRLENRIPRGPVAIATLEPQQIPEYVTVREQLVMVVMQGDGSSTAQRWQVHVLEIRVIKATPQKQDPRKI